MLCLETEWMCAVLLHCCHFIYQTVPRTAVEKREAVLPPLLLALQQVSCANIIYYNVDYVYLHIINVPVFLSVV